MSYFINSKNIFYTNDEIVIHNKPEEFWIVIHNHVLDLTPLLKDRRDSWNSNLQYLVAFGGKDLSKFFHENGFPKTEICSKSGRQRVIFPPILETAESEFCKTPEIVCKYAKFWSLDPFYHIGKLTKQDRRLRIVNTLTGKTHLLTVCEEDTILDIQRKYKKFYNSHSGSYTWRKDYKRGTISGRLNLKSTLTENGLIVEKNGIGPPPAIFLFYNDDFTVA